jgi:predicted Fe-S protein YdhL (DUF1289 family)
MKEIRVKTPCIGVCSTGIGDRVCRGCKRFAHEVIDWNSYNNQQKTLIDQRLTDFLSRCVANKLQVAEPALLERQLQAQMIDYPSHKDHYCWAYCLLKAGGNQIGNPLDYGLLIDAEFRDLPLKQLRLIIDDEFFILSDAYYERYVDASSIA